MMQLILPDGKSNKSLHDLPNASWVGSALYRSCPTFQNGVIGSIRYIDELSVDDVSVDGLSVDDLSDV